MKIKRIHILGASGSGTSTLAKALSEKLDYVHFDTDVYYWLPTEEPFTEVRELEERQKQLMNDLLNTEAWILSGSLCGWGDVFIPYFDLVVFLWIPTEIRIKRLIERQRSRYGKEIEPEGNRYHSNLNFIDWASKYDDGGLEIRSKALHEQWISNLNCKVLRIEEDILLDDKVTRVLNVDLI